VVIGDLFILQNCSNMRKSPDEIIR
jgi:hypothetical protein